MAVLYSISELSDNKGILIESKCSNGDLLSSIAIGSCFIIAYKADNSNSFDSVADNNVFEVVSSVGNIIVIPYDNLESNPNWNDVPSFYAYMQGLINCNDSDGNVMPPNTLDRVFYHERWINSTLVTNTGTQQSFVGINIPNSTYIDTDVQGIQRDANTGDLQYTFARPSKIEVTLDITCIRGSGGGNDGAELTFDLNGNQIPMLLGGFRMKPSNNNLPLISCSLTFSLDMEQGDLLREKVRVVTNNDNIEVRDYSITISEKILNI